MKCPNCGASNSDWGLFCEACGKPLKEENTIKKDRFSFDEEETVKLEQPPKEKKQSLFKKIFNMFFEEVVEEETINELDDDTQVYNPDDFVEEKTKVYTTHSFTQDENIDYDDTQVYYQEDFQQKSIDIKKIVLFIVIIALVIGLIFGGYQLFFKEDSSSTSSNTTSSSSTTQTTQSITISSVSASSTLIEEGFDHSASNMIDGDTKTAWNEGASGYGYQETVTFTLRNEASIQSMTIMNGYCKSETSYNNNNRVKQMIVYFDDNTSQRITLEDNYNQSQTITFDQSHQTKTIKLEIRTVYRGTKYNDTCISEVSFS